MKDLIVMGGAMFTVPILLLGVGVLVLSAIAFARRDADGEDAVRRDASIVTHMGLLAFVWGILGQGLGLYQAMTAIQAAADVSPAIVLGGLKVSTIAPLMGLAVFAVALIARVSLGLLTRTQPT